MNAEMPRQRKMSAREAAERFGVSPRSVRRIVAEPRPEFESKAKIRGRKILQWRSEGVLWRDIADRLEITVNAAQKAGAYALKRQQAEQPPAVDESLPPELF